MHTYTARFFRSKVIIEWYDREHLTNGIFKQIVSNLLDEEYKGLNWADLYRDGSYICTINCIFYTEYELYNRDTDIVTFERDFYQINTSNSYSDNTERFSLMPIRTRFAKQRIVGKGWMQED